MQNPSTPDTRTRLLIAARDLFWAGSYGSVSVEDICNRAEVKKGSFYHFFPGKAALALAVMQEQWACASPYLNGIVTSDKPVTTQLQEIMAGLIDCQCDKVKETGRVQGVLCLNIGHEMSSLNEELRTQAEEFIHNYIRIFERLLRNAVQEGLVPADTNTAALAHAMWAAGMGVIYHAKIHNSVELMRTELPEVWSRFLVPAPVWSKNTFKPHQTSIQ